MDLEQKCCDKGGKAVAGDKAIDLFYDGSDIYCIRKRKKWSAYNHGGSCTFAAP